MKIPRKKLYSEPNDLLGHLNVSEEYNILPVIESCKLSRGLNLLLINNFNLVRSNFNQLNSELIKCISNIYNTKYKSIYKYAYI